MSIGQPLSQRRGERQGLFSRESAADKAANSWLAYT